VYSEVVLHGKGGWIGIADELARIRSDASAKNQQVLFLISGDILGGSEMCQMSKGMHVIEIMNALGVDAVTIGNHEFDYGENALKELMSQTKFAWLGANIREESTGDLLIGVRETLVVTIDDLKIGLFGVTTQATPSLSFPTKAVRFDNVVQCAKRCTTELHNRDCDVIVALTHTHLREDMLIAKEAAQIDFVFGGHDHDPSSCVVHSASRSGSTLVMKPGMNGYFIADVEITRR
jgi:5'-nucleotidase/UDP-sugar diphosphatase